MAKINDTELIGEIKKTLIKISEVNPNWTLVLGTETLSATAVIERLDNDKKLRKAVVKHYYGLAVEIEQRGRRIIERNSSSPQV